uniref:ribosome recycling factor n=1 Tax=Hominenteromicrobium sp. TaxID=3073581 RepID=UPI003AEF28C9
LCGRAFVCLLYVLIRQLLRSIRRDAMEKLKAMKKDGELTEDDLKQAEKKTQELTDKYVKQADERSAAKQKEVLTL